MIPAPDAEDATGISHQQVSKWRKQLAKSDKYRETLFGAAHNKAMADEHNHRAQGTGENEWYTPAKYLDVVVYAAHLGFPKNLRVRDSAHYHALNRGA